MFGEFFAWWSGQLLQLVPPRLTGGRAADAHALIIAPVEGRHGGFASADLVIRRQRRDRKLGSFGLDATGLRAMAVAIPPRTRPAEVIARLPAALLLEREVTLPLAAEQEPDRVLAYEMDRLTPFSADEVFWTHGVVRRDRARGKLHLRLSIVMRDAAAPVIEALAQAGLAPTALEFEAAGGPPRRIPLQQAGGGRARLLRRATQAMALACVLLALGAIAVPFVSQSIAADRIEATIAALQPRVGEAESLRRQLAARNAGVDVAAAERSRVGDTLAVLAAVTEVLPDDTVLTDLTLRQGKLAINGQSAAAARLIAALSSDPVLRNPDFAAPVTRVESGGGDLFAIRAEIAP